MRGGQSTEHRILHKGIRSGTQLERLETNEDSGYTRVRLPSGLEGWVQSQYLSEEPIARELLKANRDKLSELSSSHEETSQQLRELESRHSQVTESNTALQSANLELQQELNDITELASNVIAIDNENRELKNEQQLLLNQIDELSDANQALKSTTEQQWFLTGAGTILVGLLIGFWISRRIYHRRSSGGWS